MRVFSIRRRIRPMPRPRLILRSKPQELLLRLLKKVPRQFNHRRNFRSSQRIWRNLERRRRTKLEMVDTRLIWGTQKNLRTRWRFWSWNHQRPTRMILRWEISILRFHLRLKLPRWPWPPCSSQTSVPPSSTTSQAKNPSFRTSTQTMLKFPHKLQAGSRLETTRYRRWLQETNNSTWSRGTAIKTPTK